MQSNPTEYHGTWRIPDSRGQFTHQFAGTLTYYGDRPSTLELIRVPSSGSIAIDCQLDVIWGQDAAGIMFSLFGATLIREENFTKKTYNIRFILIGLHVGSLEEACFDSCWIKYPYLNRWALEDRFNCEAKENQTLFSLDLGVHPPFLSVELEDGINLSLLSRVSDKITRYDITASQATDLRVGMSKKASIEAFLRIISEFSQFLSISLFAEQNPSEIVFVNKGTKVNYPLLFKGYTSNEPWVLSLVKFNELKSSMPEILRRWHANYEQVFPICRYLIRSISNNDSFDAPDFLIVAQALDGYFKRFRNFKDGRNTQQYKHQIIKLLDGLKGVDVIQRCNLDPSIIAQTRHKYSHLIPDEDKGVSQAVTGEDLYWLTQKCIVLLTCCILDMLGLTKEEINICCNNSPVEQIVLSLPI